MSLWANATLAPPVCPGVQRVSNQTLPVLGPIRLARIGFFVAPDAPLVDFLALVVRVVRPEEDRPADAREPVLALEAMGTD